MLRNYFEILRLLCTEGIAATQYSASVIFIKASPEKYEIPCFQRLSHFSRQRAVAPSLSLLFPIVVRYWELFPRQIYNSTCYRPWKKLNSECKFKRRLQKLRDTVVQLTTAK